MTSRQVVRPLLTLAVALGRVAPLFPQAATPPVELDVQGADLSLFPTPDKPATLTVRARKTADVPGTLQCRVILDNLTTRPTCGYVASGPVSLHLERVGEWREAELVVSPEPDPPPMTTGKLLIKGNIGGQIVRRDIPIRIGHGSLTFVERRAVQFADGHRALDIICLENPHLRAELLPELGTLITLISRAGRHDALLPGDVPVGFCWTGTGEWAAKTLSPCGPQVLAELTTRIVGHAVLMRATLGETDEALSLELDAGDLPSAPGPIHILSSLGQAGTDVALLPLTDGRGEVAFGPPAVVALPGQLRTSRIGLWNSRFDQTLRVEFSAPAFSSLETLQSLPWYNAAVLHLANGSPGKMLFRLSVLPGKAP